MQYRQLGRTDMKVSILSFGASSLGSVFRDVPEEEGLRTVHTALDLGINFIDTSPFYGLTKSEAMLGKALRGVARDRYFLATKCGRYGSEPRDFDFGERRITRSLDESLARMGLDYVDVLQAHDIEFGSVDQIVEQTVPALQKIKRSGKARYVGITGLPLRLFREVTGRVGPGQVDTILSYCHYELNDTSLLSILPEMKARGVGVINASPLGMGLLTPRGTPDWHPAPPRVKELCSAAARHCADRGGDIMKLAMQFSVAQPDIATTLVGTGSAANIAKNARWIEEPIDETLLREVLDLLEPIKDVTWPQGRPENN